MRRKRWIPIAILVILVVLGAGALFARPIWRRLQGVNLDSGQAGEAGLRLPQGFRASVFAAGLAGPRFMAVGPDGTLFVAEREASRVLALPDAGQTGRATDRIVVAENLRAPSSL